MRPEPGDVILYPTTPRSALSSRIVAAGEMLFGAGRGKTLYSHATILCGGNFALRTALQYESKVPWSCQTRVDDSRPFEIWQYRDITHAHRRIILNDCVAHLEEFYNMLGLLTFGLFGLPHTAVCSQWVGQRYAKAHIRIGLEGKSLLSPDAIADDRKFKKVFSAGVL